MKMPHDENSLRDRLLAMVRDCSALTTDEQRLARVDLELCILSEAIEQREREAILSTRITPPATPATDSVRSWTTGVLQGVSAYQSIVISRLLRLPEMWTIDLLVAFGVSLGEVDLELDGAIVTEAVSFREGDGDEGVIRVYKRNPNGDPVIRLGHFITEDRRGSVKAWLKWRERQNAMHWPHNTAAVPPRGERVRLTQALKPR